MKNEYGINVKQLVGRNLTRILITITAGITVAYPIQSQVFCILWRYIGGHQKASKCTSLKVLQLC